MRSIYNKLYVLVLSSALFLSCEKQVSIDLPYDGDKLVLNSLFNKDSLLYARLTASSQIKYNSVFAIPTGAVIKLYEDGILKGNLQLTVINGDSYFASQTPVVSGKTYSLKASAPGFTAVEGADKVPGLPAFRARDFRELTNNINYNSKVDIVINDPGNEANYYMLRLFRADTNISAVGPQYLINKSNRHYFRVDQVASSTAFDIFGDASFGQVVFNDETFNGKEISLTANFDDYNNSSFLAVELTSLTRESYRYIRSKDLQWDVDGNPFAEPVTVYNNITGGYGIMGGLAKAVFFIKRQ